MLQDLNPQQKAFLVLTTESGSPFHPFVKSLRRLLELPEIIADSSYSFVDESGKEIVSEAGRVVPARPADVAKVLEHHNDPRETGPIYDPRIDAIDALLKGTSWGPSTPAKEEKPAKPAKEEKPAK